MFNSSNSQSARKNSTLMRIAITCFCNVNDNMGLHSVSDFYAMLQKTISLASDGDVNFPEKNV